MASKIVLKNNLGSEFTIQHPDNAVSKAIDSKDITQAVDTINDFPTNPHTGQVVIVRDLDRGGTFIYDATKVSESNDGTNFSGWIRQYDGAVNVRWFGAIEGTDCSSHIILASLIGTPYIPRGAFVATATSLNISQLLATLNNIKVDGTLDITINTGTINLTSQIVINSPDANKITINGTGVISTTLTSFISATGSAKAYSVTVGIASSAGIEVGDYLLTRSSITGTGRYADFAGVWKITAVGTNEVTVLHTHHQATFPTMTLTGGDVKILKTVLKFTGCDGFRFEGGQPLGVLDNLAIVGDWDLSASTGTTGAHGIISASPVITGGRSSNSTYNSGGIVTLGMNVGISAFGEQGIAMSGRTGLVGNFVASCSNRKRGFYSDGASFRCKFAIASGNGEDGFIADSSGYLQAALSIACGNGMNGYWSTNNSMLSATTSTAQGNLTNGYEARGQTRLACDGSISQGNTLGGVLASDLGFIDADSVTCALNGTFGFKASLDGAIDANNSSSTSNGTYGCQTDTRGRINISGTGSVTGNTIADYSSASNSYLIKTTGILNSSQYDMGTVKTFNPAGDHYSTLIVGSTGDLFFSNDGTVRATLRNAGVFRPGADNTQTLGDASYRWSVVYAGTGTINTSDAREKTFSIIPEVEKQIAIELKGLMRRFKFNDAIETKGEDKARIHYGTSAQEVISVFEKYGLDAMQYAMVCYDEWEEQEEIKDEEGNIIQEYRPAGNRYGIRYEELLCFIISAM